jgi:hypothetical protein
LLACILLFLAAAAATSAAVGIVGA